MTIDKTKVTVFVAWTAFCFIVAWVLFSGGCGRSQPQPTVDKQKIDSLAFLKSINKKRADSIKLLKDKDAYNNNVLEEVITMFQDADSVAQTTRGQLKATQNQLAAAKARRDTIGQLRDCDSLNNQVTRWRGSYEEADKQCTDYVFKSSRELYHKDSLIDLQQRQLKGDSVIFATYNTLDKAKLTVIPKPPLLRGYLGATGSVGAYNSIGVHLDLLNRNDFMYKGAVRIGAGGLTYEAGVSKLLSFKKK